jgi:hypothetical protein
MSKPSRPSGLSRKLISLSIGMALFGVTGSTALQAQDSPDTAIEQVLEEVMVTGSRIRRQDESSASPVQTLSEEDLRIDGSLTMGETLQHLPAVGSSLNSNGSAGTSHGTRNTYSCEQRHYKSFPNRINWRITYLREMLFEVI